MRLTLDSLSVIDAIDRRGSFAAAAEELHRVPSAVTYNVNKLEEDLGVTLFDRSGHRAMLTPAGKELLIEGRHLLRAAVNLEGKVKRVATGWESELHIAVGDLVNIDAVLELVKVFYRDENGTRLRIMEEVFGGTWDALVSGRADLAIGAPGAGPAGGGYTSHAIGNVEFAFAISPDHPLAKLPEPLTNTDLMQFRSVTAADSSRNLAPMTSGLLSGQDVLTVNDMHAKYRAQRMGLGAGFLPMSWIKQDVLDAKLVIKQVEEEKDSGRVFLAWPTNHKGKALQWFLCHLKDPELMASLLNPPGE